LELYLPHKGEPSTRCHSCNHLVLASNIEAQKYCPYCGTEVKLPQPPERESKPVGVAKTV
jgi:serine protease Do